MAAAVDRGVRGRHADPDQPPELTPQAAKGRMLAVTKTKPSRRLRPGDLICGECGEGNAPTRKFCSRCGDPLLAAEVVKTPWWRKLLPTRGPKVVTVGDQRRPGGGVSVRKAGPDVRHGLRKVYRVARLAVAAVVIFAGILYGAYTPFRDLVNGEFTSVKSKVGTVADQTLVPVHPVKVTANLHDSGHPGVAAVDGFTNAYWLAPWSANDAPTLTLDFGHKVTLEKMILMSGSSRNYTADGRPATLNLIFSNDESDTIVPQDTPKAQTLAISHGQLVNKVQIQVGSTYPGLSGSNVAISDIELFGLRT